MIGRSVGSDARPLSCFLFRPRKRLEKRRKRSHIPTFPMHRSYGLQHLRHKRLTFASADKSGYTHSAFGERSHTAAHTVKQGCFGWGWYHYSRSVPHVHQHPRAGYQNGKFCRFWGLVGGAPKKRREPSGQRCAHACRCPEGVAAPLGCVIRGEHL